MVPCWPPTPVVTDASDPRWPTSIANRKVLDQYGDVYLIRTFSSWGMASNLSDADITSALEGVAANGFNGVTVWFGGGAYYGEDWSPTYQHKATSQAFWNGTPWASGLGPAWASLDHLVAEAERLGIFVWMSLDGGLGVPRADWEAVTNADMYNAGVAVATRYLSAPNVGWHVMIDDATRHDGRDCGPADRRLLPRRERHRGCLRSPGPLAGGRRRQLDQRAGLVGHDQLQRDDQLLVRVREQLDGDRRGRLRRGPHGPRRRLRTPLRRSAALRRATPTSSSASGHTPRSSRAAASSTTDTRTGGRSA